MVGQLVPANEIPLWAKYYNQEPWGFRGEDMLASKTAMHICASISRLKPGTTHADFMFQDKFEVAELSDEEFEALSKEEQDVYLDIHIRKMQMVLG